MPNKHGDFIWYELLSSDADAAQKFYGDILGWQAADSDQEGMDYRILTAKEEETGGANPVGGIMPITDEMKAGGARPVWLGYIGVDDVDKAVKAIVKAGGAVHMPAKDIPNVGRIAMVADPQGAAFYVMRGASDGTSNAFAYDKPRPGHCAWNELATTDPKAALKFYGKQFGWKKDGEMEMGPAGAYEFLRHGGLIGAVSPYLGDAESPIWTYYFRVPDIDAAIEKVKSGGGEISHGPSEIPGGEFIIHGVDPQGASFALVGARS